MSLLVAVLTLVMAGTSPAPLHFVRSSAAAPAGPTLAIEDTLHTEVPPVLVTAPRVTLDEILARVERGERRRDSLMTDQTVLVTGRLVRNADGRRPAEVLSETVTRVYKRKPDRVRTVLLRDYQAPQEKKKDDLRIDFHARPGMDEEIVNFAFRPEARRLFRYRILGRDLVGGHLVYRIGFEPRSLLDPTQPGGTVWIDTNDFVIVRQELTFRRSPAPPILKDVSRIVIERQNVAGYWVLRRMLLRAEAVLPLPKVGRSFDFSMSFDQYAINTGLPDSVFVEPGRAGRPR